MATVDITVVTKNVVGEPVSGRLRIEQPDLAGSGDLIISRILEIASTGSVTVSMTTGAPAQYYFTPDLGSDLGYFIGTLSPSVAGDFGTLVRQAAGQAIGSHTLRSASGTFSGVVGAPSKPVYFSMTVPAIRRDGVVLIPINRSIADVAGNYAISLPQTEGMYSPSSETIRARLSLETLRMGTADMTIPSQDSLKFSVTATAASLVGP